MTAVDLILLTQDGFQNQKIAFRLHETHIFDRPDAPTWAPNGPFLGHLGAILGLPGAILGPSWGQKRARVPRTRPPQREIIKILKVFDVF